MNSTVILNIDYSDLVELISDFKNIKCFSD